MIKIFDDGIVARGQLAKFGQLRNERLGDVRGIARPLFVCRAVFDSSEVPPLDNLMKVNFIAELKGVGK